VTGLVTAVHGRSIRLLVEGTEVRAVLTGKAYRGEAPAVGDLAEVRLCPDSCNSMIEAILPRRNCLKRPFAGGVQIIAANLDLALVLVSVRNPPLRRGFIDRNAASAIHEGIPVALAVNKMDLAGPEDVLAVDDLERDCGAAGIALFRVSCLSGEGIVELLGALGGRTVVMTGPSGAGKTSMVRALGGPEDVRTGDLNAKTGKGSHTTVAATLRMLPGGIALVDTPGLRAFPVDHIPAYEMQLCFPEFAGFRDSCRFRDCLHHNEPGCSVKEAAASGAVSAERYASYLQLLAEVSGG
jgi:ribosome biogenesis GTPase